MNVIRSLLSASTKNEAVVIRGNNKYFSRGGKFYHYDASGKRTEISQADYEKAVGPRVSGRPDVGAKAQNKNSIKLTINGRTYSASHPDMTGKELAQKVSDIAKHSPGRAIQWLKKNGQISHVGDPGQKGKEPKKDPQ